MKKNILLISHFPPPIGGIATWTKRVLESNLSNEYNITLINSNTIDGRDPFKHPERSLISELKRARKIFKEEKQILKNQHIDIIHTNIPCTLYGMLREMIVARIAKRKAVPVILHCHCTVPNAIKNKRLLFVFKRLLKLCKGVIVLNQASKDFVNDISPIYCEIIPNFIMDDEILKEEKIINETISNVCYIGGVALKKGCELIVRLAKEYPNINFNLVGNINKEILDMDRSANLILHGVQNKEYVYSVLKENDVFLFLTKYWGEGFSCSLTEAMGMGMPCIVTKWAANVDMIEDNGGFSIDIDDYDSLKIKFDKIMDKDIRKKFSLFNVEKAKNEYSREVIIKKISKFYENISETGR